MATTVQQDPLLAKIQAATSLTPQEMAAAHAGATSGAGSAAPDAVPYTAANPAPQAAQTAAPATQAQQQQQQNATTPVTPPGTTPPASQPVVAPPKVALAPGSTGDNVKALQDFLVSKGLLTEQQKNTGYGTYGPQTTAAVAALQKSLNVDASSGPGFFGPKTMAALNAGVNAENATPDTNASSLTTGTSASNDQGNGGSAEAGASTDTAADPYAGMNPVQRGIAMYQDISKQLGLSDVKTQYDQVIKDQKEVNDQMNSKVSEVNQDPWLSEALREAKITNIKNSYQSKLDTLTHLETLYDSIYKSGQAQVEHLVSNAEADYKAINELAQKQLDAAAALAKDNQVVSVGGREILVNKATGKKVADLGPTTHFGSSSDSSTPSLNPAQAGKYSAALSTILGSGKFTKDQVAQITNAINNGEDPFTVVKNQAKNIMGQTEATKLSSYEAADSAMRDLQKSLQAYYAGGGATNVFSGNFEKVLNRLGAVNDPAKVAIATQVAVSLQAYRNAISGTAYSNQEGQEISTVFPGINKTEGLNNAIIQGRLAADTSLIDGIYSTALGTKTYQTLKAAESGGTGTPKGTQNSTSYVESTLTKLGLKYDDVLAKIPAGEVGVIDNSTGAVGSVPASEFDAAKYTRL